MDKEPDVLTSDEREFLDQYRCETMDIEEILHEFVTSGKFGQYASNYETKDLEGEDDTDMVIYKRVETINSEGVAELRDVQIEYQEVGQVFREILADGKFLCSICLEPLYDIQLVEEALNRDETKERLTGALSLVADDLSHENALIPTQEPSNRFEVREAKDTITEKDLAEEGDIDDVEKSETKMSLNVANSNQYVHKTPCEHYYHKTCLEVWCESRNNCPMCRNLIVTEFVYLNLEE